MAMTVTSDFLVRARTCFTEENTYLVPKVHDMGGGVIGPSEKATVLLTKT